MFHILLLVADWAGAPLFVSFDLVPVFADLVCVLGALPQEVPSLPCEVFVPRGEPYLFRCGAGVEGRLGACLDDSDVAFGSPPCRDPFFVTQDLVEVSLLQLADLRAPC